MIISADPPPTDFTTTIEIPVERLLEVPTSTPFSTPQRIETGIVDVSTVDIGEADIRTVNASMSYATRTESVSAWRPAQIPIRAFRLAQLMGLASLLALATIALMYALASDPRPQRSSGSITLATETGTDGLSQVSTDVVHAEIRPHRQADSGSPTEAPQPSDPSLFIGKHPTTVDSPSQTNKLPVNARPKTAALELPGRTETRSSSAATPSEQAVQANETAVEPVSDDVEQSDSSADDAPAVTASSESPTVVPLPTGTQTQLPAALPPAEAPEVDPGPAQQSPSDDPSGSAISPGESETTGPVGDGESTASHEPAASEPTPSQPAGSEPTDPEPVEPQPINGEPSEEEATPPAQPAGDESPVDEHDDVTQNAQVPDGAEIVEQPSIDGDAEDIAQANDGAEKHQSNDPPGQRGKIKKNRGHGRGAAITSDTRTSAISKGLSRHNRRPGSGKSQR